MKIHFKIIPLVLFAILNIRCTENNSAQPNVPETPAPTYKYLALGDSYTIGQSVCDTCRFPEQLKSGIQESIENATVGLKIIATTGWTTTNLKTAIAADASLMNDYDLVTLLIGVNNQYQHKPFSLYKSEFPELVNTAIALAKGDKSNVIVVSIPDYAYTPYGQFNTVQATVSAEIAQYNTFTQNYCTANSIEFVNITDITQQGLANPALVTTDGLHPSQLAYAQFVERILPKAIAALQ